MTVKGLEGAIGLYGYLRGVEATSPGRARVTSALELTKGTDVATPGLIRNLHVPADIRGDVRVCNVDQTQPACDLLFSLEPGTSVVEISYGASQREKVNLERGHAHKAAGAGDAGERVP